MYPNMLASKSEDQYWPNIIISALPDVLKKLLEKGASISLERLQLVEIYAEQMSLETCPSEITNEARMEFYELGSDSFIDLKVLVPGDSYIILLKIKYFVRGARKYYLPQLGKEREWQNKALGAISKAELREALKAIKLDNPFYYDEELARLNGFAAPKLPVELLLKNLFKMAEDLGALNKFIGFGCTFYRAAFLGDELSVDFFANQAELVLLLKSGLDPVLQLSFFANKLSADPALNQSI